MKNPGQYVELHLDCTRHYIAEHCGPTPPAVEPVDYTLRYIALGLLIAFAIISIISIIIFVRIDRRISKELGDDRDDVKMRAAALDGTAANAVSLVSFVAVILVLVTGVVFATSFVRDVIPYHHYKAFGIIGSDYTDDRGTNFDKYEHAASLAGYQERVKAWLMHDYGIKVNTAAVGILQNKGQVAVTYNGKQVAIEFMTAGDGGLAVRQTGGQVLEPTR